MFKDMVKNDQQKAIKIGGGTGNTYNTYINMSEKKYNTSTPIEEVCTAQYPAFCADYCPTCASRGIRYDEGYTNNSGSILAVFDWGVIDMIKAVASVIFYKEPVHPALPAPTYEDVEIIEAVTKAQPITHKKTRIEELDAEIARLEKRSSVLDFVKKQRDNEAKKRRDNEAKNKVMNDLKARQDKAKENRLFKSIMENPQNSKLLKRRSA